MTKQFKKGQIHDIKFYSKQGIAGQIEILEIEYTTPFNQNYFRGELLQHQDIGHATIKYIDTKTYKNKIFKCRIVEMYEHGVAKCEFISLEQRNYMSVFLYY